MRTYTLYIHIFPNTKCYIGITSLPIDTRWGYLGSGYKHQSYLYNAIQKYGWDNIQHIVLADHLSKEWACKLEQDLIRDLKANEKEFGYNLAEGGEVNRGWHNIVSIDTKQNISKAITEWHKKPEIQERFRTMNLGKVVSEESRKRMSEAHIGLTSGMKGKKHTLESREKMSKAQKGKVISEWQKEQISKANSGRVVSEETREKIRQSRLGKCFSEEHKKKLSEAKKGRPSSRKGCTLSAEQKQKISNSLKQRNR